MSDDLEPMDMTATPEDQALFKRACLKNNKNYYYYAFKHAIKNGRLWLINELLITGEVNLLRKSVPTNIFMDSVTPIECALNAGQENAIRFLINKGANIYFLYDDVLMPFIKKERWEIIKFMVSHGANLAIDSWKPFLKTIEKKNLDVSQVMRDNLPETLPAQLKVLMRAAATDGFDISSLLADRAPPPALPPPAIVSTAVWIKSDEAEITCVSEKPAIGEKLKDIFNFKVRERLTVIESMQSKTRALFRESFDDIKNRDVLEAACDEFISQDGKIDKTAIMTRGFVPRDKHALSGGGA